MNTKDLLAFTIDEAAQVAGASRRQIGLWNQTGLFPPTLLNEPGPYGRIYSFRDLVGLRTLTRLRNDHKIPLQQLRRVDHWLRTRYNEPWSSLTFEIHGRELVFHEPETGAIVSTKPLGQGVLRFSIGDVENETEGEIVKLRERRPEQVGQVVQDRHVLGGAWRLAGTRVPTSAIYHLHAAGYSTDDILRSYPGLVRADITKALEHEESIQRARKPTRSKRAS